jgi:hypothetical protein
MTTSKSIRVAMKDPSLDYADAMNLNKSFKESFKESENNQNYSYNDDRNENEETLKDI